MNKEKIDEILIDGGEDLLNLYLRHPHTINQLIFKVIDKTLDSFQNEIPEGEFDIIVEKVYKYWFQ